MDRERIGRAALCGLSLGGMTAMRVALVAPAKVSALALLDTSADAEGLRGRAQTSLMAVAVRVFGHRGPVYRVIAQLMFSPTAAREQPELVARELARMREKDRRGIFYTTLAAAGRDSVLAELAGVRCPTLVLVGEEDVATPPRVAERIAQAVEGARLVCLPKIGHLSALEAPDAVADHLLGWLAAAEP
jgi:pimeloyl-ACP methyl ester carboxylesterase